MRGLSRGAFLFFCESELSSDPLKKDLPVRLSNHQNRLRAAEQLKPIISKELKLDLSLDTYA